MHAAQADQGARLPDERRAGAPRREPGVLEAGVLDLAHDVQVPVLRLPRLIPDALERNAHLDFVSPIGDTPARLNTKSGLRSGCSRPTTALPMKPPAATLAPSIREPSPWTPSGFTANIKACFPS